MKNNIANRFINNHIILLGIPYDQNSSFLRGSADGPRAIREILYSGSSNYFTENGLNLERDGYFIDKGDLDF